MMCPWPTGWRRLESLGEFQQGRGQADQGGCLGHAALSDFRLPSRVHITEATLNHLDKAYEVEDGNGQQRDPYLKEMNIRTYLVIDPRVQGLWGWMGDWAAWEQGPNY